MKKTSYFVPGKVTILLLLLIGCLPALAQNSAGLTLRGVMPAIQRVNIGPIQSTTSVNGQSAVVLAAQSNADAHYVVTLQSKSPGTQAPGYQLTYDGHPVTLKPGSPTVLFENTGDATPKTLLVSSPSGPEDGTLALTIISQ